MSKESKGAGVAEPPVETEGARVRAKQAGRDGAGVVKDEAQAKHGPPRSVAREYFESLLVTAIMALFGMTFVVQAVKVPTGSMQNTILIGDHLLVNKFIFAPGPIMPFLPQREIRRGDIIVFKYPGKYQGEERFRDNDEVDDTLPNNIPYKTDYVKRVIGLPGDVIEVRDSKVFVNAQPLEEHVVSARNGDDNPRTPENEGDAPLAILDNPAPSSGETYNVYLDPRRHGFMRRDDRTFIGDGKFIVPGGHYFAMGDNRDNSQDSRFWGYVPRSAIIGRAMFVYWSYDESAPRSNVPLPFNYLVDFFTNTRWRRTGTLVK
jgi:signal peptidase I